MIGKMLGDIRKPMKEWGLINVKCCWIFLILLFLGMPVAFAIAVSGFSFFLMRPEIPWTILVQKSLSTTQSFTMLAIPLFILPAT